MSNTHDHHPMLVIYDERQHQHTWALDRPQYIIGRDETCDIVIAEREISRQHVRIYATDDVYYLQDLESRNGTWVNDLPIKDKPVALKHDDRIRLATTTRILFVGVGETLTALDEVPLMIEGGRLRIDRNARRVFVNDVEIDPPLSPPQYRLLELLYTSDGMICTREAVIEAVWPDAVSDGVSEQAIDALIRRLRDRLTMIDPDWQYIITMRGHGFRLNNR